MCDLQVQMKHRIIHIDKIIYITNTPNKKLLFKN